MDRPEILGKMVEETLRSISDRPLDALYVDVHGVDSISNTIRVTISYSIPTDFTVEGRMLPSSHRNRLTAKLLKIAEVVWK